MGCVSVIFCLSVAAKIDCFGKLHSAPRWNFRSSIASDLTLPSGWSNTWRHVERLVRQAPPSKLVVEWQNNVKIEPNMTTIVGLMTEACT